MSGMIPIPVLVKERECTAKQLATRKRNRFKRRVVIALLMMIILAAYLIFGRIDFIAVLIIGGIAGVVLGLWQESEK